MDHPTIEANVRPAAIVPVAAAVRIVAALEGADVSKGGVWNVSTSIWQRYDVPWDGAAGSRGSAGLVGTIAVVYDRPRRHEITIYKVSLTMRGVDAGWTPESLCDDALRHADLTMATCPRDALSTPPASDPFKDRDAIPRPRERSSIWQTDVGELMRTDLRDLVSKLRRDNADGISALS